MPFSHLKDNEFLRGIVDLQPHPLMNTTRTTVRSSQMNPHLWKKILLIPGKE